MSLPRLFTPVRAAWLIPAVVFLAAAASGCEDRKFFRQRASPSTARDTFERLRDCRKTGAYAAMRPYIHDSGRDGMIDLLVAVDELVLANAAVQEAVRQVCPGTDAPYDLSAVQDWLEIFSREVNLIDVKQTGDQATLTFQIARRLPVISTQFVRTDGVWQYVPAPDQAGVVRAVRQLTRALGQIELSLSKQPVLTPEQVREEYRTRLEPKLKVFRQLQGQTAAPQVASLHTAA
jgi:hypothetical protein